MTSSLPAQIDSGSPSRTTKDLERELLEALQRFTSSGDFKELACQPRCVTFERGRWLIDLKLVDPRTVVHLTTSTGRAETHHLNEVIDGPLALMILITNGVDSLPIYAPLKERSIYDVAKLTLQTATKELPKRATKELPNREGL